jgi:hypothetical protein
MSHLEYHDVTPISIFVFTPRTEESDFWPLRTLQTSLDADFLYAFVFLAIS